MHRNDQQQNKIAHSIRAEFCACWELHPLRSLVTSVFGHFHLF